MVKCSVGSQYAAVRNFQLFPTEARLLINERARKPTAALGLFHVCIGSLPVGIPAGQQADLQVHWTALGELRGWMKEQRNSYHPPCALSITLSSLVWMVHSVLRDRAGR